MMIEVLKSKLHCVQVTEANLNYMGSITIDEDLMDAANLIAGAKALFYIVKPLVLLLKSNVFIFKNLWFYILKNHILQKLYDKPICAVTLTIYKSSIYTNYNI